MRARFLALALLVLPISAGPPDKVALKWGMKPHDFLHYAVTHECDDRGKKVQWQFLEHPVDLFGCDFDKDGRLALRSQSIHDVPLALVFQTPDHPVAPGEKWKLAAAWDCLWGYPRLVAEGVAEYKGTEAIDKVTCHVWKGAAVVVEEKGKTFNVTREWIDGRVEWTTWFEAETSLVRRVESTFTAHHIGRPKGNNEKPTELSNKEVLTRGELWPDRYEKFQERVDKAIDQGVAWVKGLQKPDGSWDAYREWTVGPTALALLTMLKGGVKHDDPGVQKGLEWLVKQPMTRTYEVALSMVAIDAFYTPAGEQEAIRKGQVKDFKRSLSPAHLKWMKDAVDWMTHEFHGEGIWGYPTGSSDLSNTQYAVLALHAAGRCGVWAEERVWLAVIRNFLQQQQKVGPAVKYTPKPTDGSSTEVQAQARGFPYWAGGTPTGSMTCAGLAVLVLSRDALGRIGSTKLTPAEAAKLGAAIKDGVGWLSDHYTVRANDPANRDWYWYYLYGLERAGTLADFDRLGGHDWYYEGACVLVANQFGDGHWQDSAWCWMHDSCFAILFLKRATTALPTK